MSVVGELLVFGAGVLLGPGAGVVVLRRGRASASALPNAYLPPPAGHRAEVVTLGERSLRCPCGWSYALPWPSTSGRVNRARLGHYAAVEQARIAQRLGVDTDAVLDALVTARRALVVPEPAVAPPAPAPRQPVAELQDWGVWSRRSPARDVRRAAEARRASAIARVEAGRVLPEHAGTEGSPVE